MNGVRTRVSVQARHYKTHAYGIVRERRVSTRISALLSRGGGGRIENNPQFNLHKRNVDTTGNSLLMKICITTYYYQYGYHNPVLCVKVSRDLSDVRNTLPV